MPADLSGEVDILVPGIERQRLVHPDAMPAHHIKAHGHVAAIAVEMRRGGQRVARMAVLREDRPAFRGRVARRVGTVGQHRAWS